MSRMKTVTQITEIVTRVAPQLRYVAAYNADDPQLAGSMKLYPDRSFIYVLTLQFANSESCIYVGQTRAQYARFLQHRSTFVFDRIYLYECPENDLKKAEAAVIHRLKPLFNKTHNPESCRYERVLRLAETEVYDREMIINCYQKWNEYCSVGLFGFALPPVLFRLLKANATAHKLTVSEELTGILESFYADEIADELNKNVTDEAKTNLKTTMDYGAIHQRTHEQIKQYLHQSDRLIGEKIGQSWVLIEDERFPKDRRKKDSFS